MTIVSKQQSLADKLKSFIDTKILKKKEVSDFLDNEVTTPEQSADSERILTPKPELSDYIAGEIAEFTEDYTAYLPIELIAGEVPYIQGLEKETVWNAASQACATEKVHFSYAIDIQNNKVSYLACPSSTLSSAPDSWCPLVTALPGNPEFIDKETVYVYEQDASTAAMRWNEETGRIQLFIGASRTILPKIQSMDTNFVTIGQDNPNVIPWKNSQLKTEKLARALIRALTLSGALLATILLVILIFNGLSLTFTKKDLSQIEKDTQKSSNTLIENAYKAMHSDVINHSIRIQELIDELPKIDGTLVKYEVSKGKVTWEALVPLAYANSNSSKIKGKIIEEDEARTDGRVRIQGNR